MDKKDKIEVFLNSVDCLAKRHNMSVFQFLSYCVVFYCVHSCYSKFK